MTWMRLVHSSCTRPSMRVVMAAFLCGVGRGGGGEVKQGSEACCAAVLQWTLCSGDTLHKL